MGDLNEAFVQMRALQQFPFVDDQPDIEAAAAHLSVTDTWASPSLFAAQLQPLATNERFRYFLQEAQAIGRLEENVLEGQHFLSQLYAYRSVSRAIPQAQQDHKDKMDINEKTYEVLKPEIDKAKKLMIFCEKAVQTIVQIITSILEERKKEKVFVSDELLLALAKNFNMFIVLDALKNMKTSLANDCAMYKRALTNMKVAGAAGDKETKDNEMLRMFLANNDAVKSNLKTQLANLPVEDILVDMVNLCCDMFEERKYLVPETKHLLLKAMAFGLYLLDDEKRNMEKVKSLKLDRYSKVFKVNPVVPFTGDLSSTLESIWGRNAKFVNEYMKKYVSTDEEKAGRYSLVVQLEEAKSTYVNFVNAFGVMLNETRVFAASGEVSSSQAKIIYNLLLVGVQLIGRWTAAVSEQTAWKFLNPTDHIHNPHCPEYASDYEKAMRYNYSSAEKFAFIEYIAMIKSLQSMMAAHLTLFDDAIRKHIFTELQTFVQITLAEITAHAAKKKKAVVSTLMYIRDIAADTSQGLDMSTGTVKGTKKKGTATLDSPSASVQGRSVGIYGAQLILLRALLDSAFDDRAAGMKGGFMKDKDFSSQEVDDMTKFYNDSRYFPEMLNFSHTLEECSDLSELWYKEFFLELSKEIQFPIEMSLPWILTDHILETEAADMMECLLYPLDLYNDAAHRALHKLQRQFLFDEIEAELNLAFDQFLVKLAHKVFIYYKTIASSHLINKRYQADYQNFLAENEQGGFEPPVNRYESVLQQRHVQMLGRSIDINKLVSQRFQQNLRKSLEVAIVRFEVGDLTGIYELQVLLEHNRITHELASKVLSLGAFDELLAEVDETISLPTYTGRIITHAMSEVVNDFLPNFCYNSVTERFVRTLFPLVNSVQRGHVPKTQPYFLFGTRHFTAAFGHIFEVNRGFVGEIHILALVRLVGRDHLPVILGELVNNCEVVFNTIVKEYVETISRGFPQSSKLPPIVFGLRGVFDYFSSILKPIVTYRDLKTEVFQGFREVGNSFALAHIIDKITRHQEMYNIAYSSQYLGIQAPSSEGPPDQHMKLRDVIAANNAILAQSVVNYGELAQKVDELTRPNSQLPSFFQSFTKKFDTILDGVRGKWRGSEPSNDVIEIDYCVEFYRLWSAIQFVYCIPNLNPNEFTTRELFGEGLQWAGLAIIFLLGQHDRFNAFDFSYHILAVSHLDKKGAEAPASPAGVDMSKFVESATFYKAINDEFFQYLFRRLGASKKQVGVFLPPGPGQEDGRYQSYEGEHGTAPRVVTEKKLIPIQQPQQ